MRFNFLVGYLLLSFARCSLATPVPDYCNRRAQDVGHATPKSHSEFLTELLPPQRSDELTPPAAQYETLLASLQRQYGDSHTAYLGRGGESLAFEVDLPVEGKCAIRFPVSDKIEGKVTANYEREVRILAAAAIADSEGAKHLIRTMGLEKINDGGKVRVGIKTELLPLGSLDTRLNSFGSRVSERVLLSTYRELAVAVRAVHRAGFVHQDIKPENILLRRDARGVHLALADFGTATEKNTKLDWMESGIGIGSVGYAHPDQIAGEKARSEFDLYALRRVFAVMQHGAPPVEGENALNFSAADRRRHPEVVRLLSREFDSIDELIRNIDRAQSQLGS